MRFLLEALWVGAEEIPGPVLKALDEIMNLILYMMTFVVVSRAAGV